MFLFIRHQRVSFVKSKLNFPRPYTTKYDDTKDKDDSSNIEIPEAPTTCCMSACPNCVWIEYANQLNEIFRDGGEKSLKIIEEKIADLFSTLVSNNYGSQTNVITIEESECSDASFLISSFMWEALNVYNAEIVTIMFHNSVQHYQQLVSKITQNRWSLYNKPKSTDLSPDDFMDNDRLNVTNLLSSLRDVCSKITEANVLLIIDDISYIYLLSSYQDCIYFIRYCSKLLSTFPKLRIVIGSHTSPDDEELNAVSRFLQHFSQLNLTVTPLQSGFSSEVTGHLTIASKTKLLETKVNKYYYKLEDKKISINPYIV